MKRVAITYTNAPGWVSQNNWATLLDFIKGYKYPMNINRIQAS